MSPEINTNDPFVQEVFKAIEGIRESGVVNMFGAAPLLERMYGFDHNTASRFLSMWMDTFKDRVS